MFSKVHNQIWSAKLSLEISIYHFHILQMKSFNENKEFFFQDWNCIANGHAKLSCFIHFRQPNNNMHGYLTSFKKLISKANMSRFHIALRHPLIEICRNCCYRCKIWEYIQIHYLFDHGKKHFLHMKKTRRKLNKKTLLQN